MTTELAVQNMGDLQTLDRLEPRALPFVVEEHPMMVARVAGKAGDTVLTIERNLYNYKICEYDGPFSYFRQWCYAEMPDAVAALVRYLCSEQAQEPSGWLRAISPEHGERRGGQRARVQQEVA